MHKRNVIAILLTAVVFIAAVVLGVYSVYRVDAVTLNVSVISAVAREEADALAEKSARPLRGREHFFRGRGSRGGGVRRLSLFSHDLLPEAVSQPPRHRSDGGRRDVRRRAGGGFLLYTRRGRNGAGHPFGRRQPFGRGGQRRRHGAFRRRRARGDPRRETNVFPPFSLSAKKRTPSSAACGAISSPWRFPSPRPPMRTSAFASPCGRA